MGSLAGAAHLLQDNAGVLRAAQWEQKSHIEYKGKSRFDMIDFQYESKPWKRGLAIPNVVLPLFFKKGGGGRLLRVWGLGCQKSYHRDNWLVAAKRS